MTIEQLKRIIPVFETVDNFGAAYIVIKDMSKIKARNILVKNGFVICENSRYLKYENCYIYDNKLKSYLIVNFDKIK
jgi:hypothetical protein